MISLMTRWNVLCLSTCLEGGVTQTSACSICGWWQPPKPAPRYPWSLSTQPDSPSSNPSRQQTQRLLPWKQYQPSPSLTNTRHLWKTQCGCQQKSASKYRTCICLSILNTLFSFSFLADQDCFHLSIPVSISLCFLSLSFSQFFLSNTLHLSLYLSSSQVIIH